MGRIPPWFARSEFCPLSTHTSLFPHFIQALWLVKMLKGELELPLVHEMKEDVRLQQG